MDKGGYEHGGAGVDTNTRLLGAEWRCGSQLGTESTRVIIYKMFGP